jgi:hypothetical protein
MKNAGSEKKDQVPTRHEKFVCGRKKQPLRQEEVVLLAFVSRPFF